jgi:hypothetical protein
MRVGTIAAKGRKPVRPPGRPRGPSRAITIVRFRPDQRDAIERLVAARPPRAGKPDYSGVVRDLVDEALRARGIVPGAAKGQRKRGAK